MTPVRAANETMYDSATILSSPLSAQETIAAGKVGPGGVYCILQPVTGEWAGRREQRRATNRNILVKL